jgi:hypothetical protein
VKDRGKTMPLKGPILRFYWASIVLSSAGLRKDGLPQSPALSVSKLLRTVQAFRHANENQSKLPFICRLESTTQSLHQKENPGVKPGLCIVESRRGRSGRHSELACCFGLSPCGELLLAFGDDVVLQVARYWRVLGQLHRECSLALSHTSQVR